MKCAITPTDSSAASREVPAKLSHRPVKPKGHNKPMSKTGNTRAVHTEIREAWNGLAMASG